MLSRAWRTEERSALVSVGRSSSVEGRPGPGRRAGPAFQSQWAGKAQAQQQPGATAASSCPLTCPHLSLTLTSKVPFTAGMRANERRALEVSLSVCLKLLVLAVPL